MTDYEWVWASVSLLLCAGGVWVGYGWGRSHGYDLGKQTMMPEAPYKVEPRDPPPPPLPEESTTFPLYLGGPRVRVIKPEQDPPPFMSAERGEYLGEMVIARKRCGCESAAMWKHLTNNDTYLQNIRDWRANGLQIFKQQRYSKDPIPPAYCNMHSGAEWQTRDDPWSAAP